MERWRGIFSRGILRDLTVYQSNGIRVVNKPPNFVVHPSKFGPWSSLTGAVKAVEHSDTCAIVGRLDRETSGAVLVATDPGTSRMLEAGKQCGLGGKIYVGIVNGSVPMPLSKVGTINLAIGPHHDSDVAIKMGWAATEDSKFRTAVQPTHDLTPPEGADNTCDPQKAKPATTLIRKLAEKDGKTLVAAMPMGGARQHQIRVHLSAIGCPLVC